MSRPVHWITRPRTRIGLLLVLWGGLMGVIPPVQAIDVFDRHGYEILKQITEAGNGLSEVTQQQAAKLKPLDRDLESACLVFETNGGNVAKVLVSWGFRKSLNADKPTPVVMLDRFVTYERGKGDSTVANGRNVMLFPGFQFDFDLGQIVPDGFGADLAFTDKGALRGLDGAKVHLVSGSQLPVVEDAGPAKKTNDSINPEDFTGVWTVDGDGRLIGEWDLTVNEQGQATGKYHSAESDASYPIVGQIAAQPSQIRLQVQFDNAIQVIDAYLWSKDKSKIAGTYAMAGRKFGIVATRNKGK